MTPNQRAFLDMLAHAEGTDNGRQKTYDRGYDVMVYGQLLMSHYRDHPRSVINGRIPSSAAGRYQIMRKTWDSYKKILKLKDFSPASQDAVALRLIKDEGAERDVINGNFEIAVTKCNNIWASLPGANYKNQHMQKMADLKTAYISAGGKIGIA